MVASFIFRLRSSIIENVAICMASNICISFDSGSSIGAKWRKSSLPAAVTATTVEQCTIKKKKGEKESGSSTLNGKPQKPRKLKQHVECNN